MSVKALLSITVTIFLSVASHCQEKIAVVKKLPAQRTDKHVVIDGLLTDSAWKDAALMTDLVYFNPKMGVKEPYENRTETWLMYSDEGIYFGGYCYERTKDSIAAELKGRDGFGMNDYIGIILDTYTDKLNGFEYFVTPLNEQWDSKMSPPAPGSDNGGEDFNWNAVWKSGVVIHNDGWSFEMFIPFSAIRFGKKPIQDWGLNITRRRRKTEQQSTWNPIDVNVNGFLTQEGLWTGITDIKPPVRLQFSPYFSVYTNHYPVNQPGINNWTNQVNGGLDVKYGLSQAFTLDATLIPDFGQVQSDNRVLNLTPFDVQFNENRSFFTEGTELFGKGGLFYSRRIGIEPVGLHSPYNNLGANETVIKDPQESKLINASKISGRTQKGLGIGILNAITKTRYATIENEATKDRYKVITDPLTNYNVLVLDQTLKHNSSISFINTNVLRNGNDYDANVSAALFNFNDKKNTWNAGGKLASSSLFNYLPNGKTSTGYSHNLYVGKVSGRFNFQVSQDLTDTKYTHQDLGYFTNNNFLDHSLYVGYRWTEPKTWYNRIFLNFNTRISKLLTNIATIREKYQSSNFRFNGNVQTKKLNWFALVLEYSPYQNDFYEPHWAGSFFRRGSSGLAGIDFESNESKRYSVSTETFVRKYFNFYNLIAADFEIAQTYRFNNRFALLHAISWQPRKNSVGYTWSENADEIIFARRNVNTIENVLEAKYSFTNRMGINFRARHYLSSVDNKQFYTLQNDGKLADNPSFALNTNRNVNFFNIDMVYTWQFAPGSFLNAVWKNAIVNFSNQVEQNYFKNFSNTVESDNNNNLSLKVIYFLDYLSFKKHKK